MPSVERRGKIVRNYTQELAALDNAIVSCSANYPAFFSRWLNIFWYNHTMSYCFPVFVVLSWFFIE